MNQAQAIPRLTPHEQLLALPENQVGEIIGGQLHVQQNRPTGPQIAAAGAISSILGLPFHRGQTGSGGRWILIEPEIHFIRDTEVVVPDLAGWRRERMPAIPRDHRFEVVPDWVCEILAPSTAQKANPEIAAIRPLRRRSCLVSRSAGAHAGSLRAARRSLAAARRHPRG